MTDLSKLPGISDYQHLIFMQLDCKDLLQCAKVSKSWNKMINQFYDLKLILKLIKCSMTLRRIETDLKAQFEGLRDLHMDLKEWDRTFQKSFRYDDEKAKIIHYLSEDDLKLKTHGDPHVRTYTDEEYKSVKWIVCENNSVLHFASLHGMTKLVEYILNSIQECGINVNARNRIRRTAFLCACRNGHKDIVKMFLAHRANMDIDVNDFDHYEQTPLISAAMNGHHEVVKMLLQSPGIDVNAIDSLSRTAFIWACLNGNVEVVKVIMEFAIEKSIDLNKADNAHRPGYFNACFYPSDNRRKISKLLRENGVRIGLDLNFRDIYTNMTGDEWRIRRESSSRPIHPVTTLFVCTNDCCLKFNPYPKNFPKMSDEARREDRDRVQEVVIDPEVLMDPFEEVWMDPIEEVWMHQ